MKNVRIILAVLIVVGLALLATKKFWVPKLVEQILSYDTLLKAPIITENVGQSIVRLTDGRQCYMYSHKATSTDPYATSELMDITIKGNSVTGKKRGTQSGPDMTNGYEGTITGTLEENTITAVFSYVIEGSGNKEREIYRASTAGIEKLRYPLVEQGGMLVPDETKSFTALSYVRINCDGSR